MYPQELPYLFDKKERVKSPPAQNNEREELIIFADGAAQGNPGEAGAGIVITDSQGKILAELKYYLGKTTNNVAEYKALILALEKARQFKAKRLKVFMDSELIVRQIQGDYKVRDGKLKTLHAHVQNLLKNFTFFNIKYIRRGQNKRADKLAKEAIASSSLGEAR